MVASAALTFLSRLTGGLDSTLFFHRRPSGSRASLWETALPFGQRRCITWTSRTRSSAPPPPSAAQAPSKLRNQMHLQHDSGPPHYKRAKPRWARCLAAARRCNVSMLTRAVRGSGSTISCCGMLKGVPKTHVYRDHPLRRGARQQAGGPVPTPDWQLGDEVPRAAGAGGRTRQRGAGAGAASSRSSTKTSSCWRSTSRPAWRCMAAAASASA